MPEKGLTFFTGNPFHEGHLALIRTALKQVEVLDIYVGVRAKPWTLPREIRIKALEEGLTRQGLMSRVQIISTAKEVRGSILTIGPLFYNTLAMGSDIANQFDPDTGVFRDYERAHFLSFPTITILEREGYELIAQARAAIEQAGVELVIHPSITEIKGTSIRKKWNAGEDIRPYLPDGVMEVIEPYIHVFRNQPE